MKFRTVPIASTVSLALIWVAAGIIAQPQSQIVAQALQDKAIPEQQIEAVLDISLSFKPNRPVTGREVTFTIFATHRRGGDVSGASVPIMFERALVPMSTMEMLGGADAVEKSPGAYEASFTFNRQGSYVVHVHVLPKGETNMMRNHADFGPLFVSGEEPLSLFLTPLAFSIMLLGASAASYVVHRLYKPSLWLKLTAIALVTTGVAVGVAALLLPGQIESDEPPKLGQQQGTITIKGGSYMIDQKDNFVPNVATAIVGLNNTITWHNRDGSSHSIVHLDRNPKFASPLLNFGETWTHTFTEPGIYYYHCLPHPWMQGAIVVAKRSPES